MKKVQQIKIFPKKKLSFGSIKTQIDSLVLDSVSRTGMRLGFIVLGLSVVILAWHWLRLPPEVPLLFSKPYGESQLISVWGLLMLPVFSLMIQIICVRWAIQVLDEDKLLAQLLTWIGSLVSLMNLISLVKVIGLVV
ncbi:MAG: hypothetical protein ABIJ43_05120 [Candidatus Beckwithbacteria bacterium]|nr:hypothetical protein [Patescibacteria group bacterium]